MKTSGDAEVLGKRRRGRPSRPAPDTEETKERLLEAAIGLFARHGYEAVTTVDIVRGDNYDGRLSGNYDGR